MVELYVILALGVIAGFELVLLCTAKKRFIRRHVVDIEDVNPETDTMQARALQLSNELSRYIEIKDKKIKLRVYKD